MKEAREAKVVLQLSKTKENALVVKFRRDEETNYFKCNSIIALIKNEFYYIAK